MRKSSILLFWLLTALAIFLLFHFLDVFLIIALWLGISLILVIFAIMSIILIISLLALPYYLIKQKKKIQEYGNYDLNDVKGKKNE